ncbi:enolase-phosphatase E1-like [Xenopus tropicalis]|uniref:Enolase-phosphatase E1-like n=1 Tax=Xenopus tropicalis TaxID=8364 RepID=A0A8J1JLV2_XENTR|nr:enolase-phosphatase E1-like [Xenopus tropicalis]
MEFCLKGLFLLWLAVPLQGLRTLPKRMAPLQRLKQDTNQGPVFGRHLYSVNILNSIRPMSPIIRVTAKKSGIAGSGPLTYRLVNQSGNEFDINNHTGQIYVVSVAGKAGTFTLRVQASDQAGRSDQAIVKIRVDPADSSISTDKGVVILKLNQTRNSTEQLLPNIISILTGILHQNIWVQLVSSAKSGGMSGEITSIWFQAADKNNQVARAEEVLRNLTDNIRRIQEDLGKLFRSPVEVSVSKALAVPVRYGPETAGAVGAVGAALGACILGLSLHIISRKKSKNLAEDKVVIPGTTDLSQKEKEKEPPTLDNGNKGAEVKKLEADEKGKEEPHGDDRKEPQEEADKEKSPSEETTSPATEEPAKDATTADDQGGGPVETVPAKESEAGGEAAAPSPETEHDKATGTTAPETSQAAETQKDKEEEGKMLSTTATFLDDE